MSKSLGNVIAPHDLVARYGVDQARYFMLREVPFGNDGNFSHEGALNRINSELANGLGNLSQRSLSMIYKNCDGKIPECGALTKEDEALLSAAQNDMLTKVRAHLDEQQFHKAIEIIMNVTNDANAYIDHQAPWGLKKTDPERMNTVLYVLAETIRCLALIMQPFTPQSASKMLDQIESAPNERGFEALNAGHALKSLTQIEKPEGIFPRLMDEAPVDKAANS
jgi:methionyl-tRNA synthetase